jgi:transcriptional regulator with XRE-family HTH domain
MTQKEELREFLRSRRARITPEQAGLTPSPGHRRVAGLRREELAQLAGVSMDYYVRLEQGRGTGVSEEVLAGVARALQLDEAERAHLMNLARPPRSGPALAPQLVRPGVRWLLDSLATPAFVFGLGTDVLAINGAGRALLCDFEAMAPEKRNHARWVLLEPEPRELYVDWVDVARVNVAMLRLDAGRHPDDPRLATLIDELSEKSPEFRSWWTTHDVLQRTHGSRHYRHPLAGELELYFEALRLPGDSEQTLFVYSAQPGSPSARALAELVRAGDPR